MDKKMETTIVYWVYNRIHIECLGLRDLGFGVLGFRVYRV